MTDAQRRQLRQFVQGWTYGHQLLAAGNDAGAIADALSEDTGFATIRVAGFLQSPDGEALTKVVTAALPFPYSLQATVMVDAIKLAGQKRTNDQRLGTVVAGLAVAIGLGFFFGGGASA
jgi:hypothetical protein